MFVYRADWAEQIGMRAEDDIYTWDEFWDMVNDPTVVSANILQPEDVQILRSGRNQIVAIFVPRAGFRHRPVHVGEDPYTGSYYRRGEGDWRLPRREVEAMLRDREDPDPAAGLPR